MIKKCNRLMIGECGMGEGKRQKSFFKGNDVN